MFTGNRGCVVDDRENVVRHHGSSLWISCLTEFRGWRWPLARPGRWTPLFFLDDAVALAAGHRPCATCRSGSYRQYRDAVTVGTGAGKPLLASELNARLISERHVRGRGLERAADRMTWTAPIDTLPTGTVIVDGGHPHLIAERGLLPFSFGGWLAPHPTPRGDVTVLTPPTSVLALANGFEPVLHPSAVQAQPLASTPSPAHADDLVPVLRPSARSEAHGATSLR